jgi:TonB family protein
VALGELQRLAVPAYPVAAERECISGVVTLEVTVRPDGRAGRIEVVRGHALLAAAAKATARRARWEVTTLNREPMERTAMLQFAFLLTRRRCGL